jgi:hypothetical protein
MIFLQRSTIIAMISKSSCHHSAKQSTSATQKK